MSVSVELLNGSKQVGTGWDVRQYLEPGGQYRSAAKTEEYWELWGGGNEGMRIAVATSCNHAVRGPLAALPPRPGVAGRPSQVSTSRGSAVGGPRAVTHVQPAPPMACVRMRVKGGWFTCPSPMIIGPITIRKPSGGEGPGFHTFTTRGTCSQFTGVATAVNRLARAVRKCRDS